MVETLCGRVGCGEPATSILLMAPQDTQAWLVGLDSEYAPEGVPLCGVHADRITVPFGWTIHDDRPPVRPKRKRRKRAAAGTDRRTQDQESATPVAAKAPPGSETATEPAPDGVAGSKPETLADRAPEAAAEPRPEVLGDPAADAVPGVTDGTGGGRGGPPVPDAEPAAGQARLPHPRPDHPSSPAEVPVNADEAAAAVEAGDRRLAVVPGDDDPAKTFDFEDDGQGALWAERDVAREPDESTPLLKRAFRVVRDD